MLFCAWLILYFTKNKIDIIFILWESGLQWSVFSVSTERKKSLYFGGMQNHTNSQTIKCAENMTKSLSVTKNEWNYFKRHWKTKDEYKAREKKIKIKETNHRHLIGRLKEQTYSNVSVHRVYVSAVICRAMKKMLNTSEFKRYPTKQQWLYKQ